MLVCALPSKEVIVIRKVLEGEHPSMPEGAERAWFTDDLWRTLNLCWATRPENRPSIEAVFERLERVSRTWKPPSPQANENAEKDDSDWDLTTEIIRPGSIPSPRLKDFDLKGVFCCPLCEVVLTRSSGSHAFT